MLTKNTSVCADVGVTTNKGTGTKLNTHDTTSLMDFCRQQLGLPAGISVDVTFVEEPIMTDLHVRYMGLPGPTDVLSFPAIDVANGLVDPQSLQDEPTLGDIVICPDFIESNTRSEPTQMNIDACVIHGMLHLIGHDHQTASDAKIMFEKQEALMLSWQKSK
jgi:probable rRNA maturation factor